MPCTAAPNPSATPSTRGSVPLTSGRPTCPPLRPSWWRPRPIPLWAPTTASTASPAAPVPLSCRIYCASAGALAAMWSPTVAPSTISTPRTKWWAPPKRPPRWPSRRGVTSTAAPPIQPWCRPCSRGSSTRPPWISASSACSKRASAWGCSTRLRRCPTLRSPTPSTTRPNTALWPCAPRRNRSSCSRMRITRCPWMGTSTPSPSSAPWLTT